MMSPRVILSACPKRRVQRVVCRMLVHPSGNGPTDAIKGAITSAFENVKNFLSEKVELFKGWIMNILNSISQSPRNLMEKAAEMTCGGMAKLDQLTLENVPGGSTMVDSEGRIRINASAQSKAEGFERCHRVSRPPVSTCGPEFGRRVRGPVPGSARDAHAGPKRRVHPPPGPCWR